MKRIAALILIATATAHADSRAWTAAKQVLPDGLKVLGGVNAASIRASKLYEKMWPIVMAKAGDAQTNLDRIKTTCKLDVTGQVDSMVVGMTDQSQGVIVVAFKGVTQKDIDSCFDKLTKADGKPMTVAKTGAITKYTSDGKDLYIRWLAKDVGAMATTPDDKDLLVKLTSGGGKQKAFKSEASVWVAADQAQDLDQIHAKMSRAYGFADLKAGNMATEIHIVVDNAKVATDAAKQSNDQFEQFKKSGQVPPVFDPLLKTLVVKSSGNELVITAQMAEDDAIALISAMMAMLGH